MTCFIPAAPSAPPWTRFSITAGPAACNSACSLIADTANCPIEAAFVGRTVQTSDAEIIEVKLYEIDQEEQVLLVERIS